MCQFQVLLVPDRGGGSRSLVHPSFYRDTGLALSIFLRLYHRLVMGGIAHSTILPRLRIWQSAPVVKATVRSNEVFIVAIIYPRQRIYRFNQPSL
jgi:hypothetical protein